MRWYEYKMEVDDLHASDDLNHLISGETLDSRGV